jgi:hypothetical protein
MRAAGPLAGLASSTLLLSLVVASCAPAEWTFGLQADDGGTGVDVTAADTSSGVSDGFAPNDSQGRPFDGSFPLPDGQAACNNVQVCGCPTVQDCSINSNNTICDSFSHQCVECVDSSDCSSQHPLQWLCLHNQCVKKCDADAGDNCPPGQTCGTGGLCQECGDARDCASNRKQIVCDPVNLHCVQCLSPSDCTPTSSNTIMGCSLVGNCYPNGSGSGGGSSSTNHDP